MKFLDILYSSLKVFFFINIKKNTYNLYDNLNLSKLILYAVLLNIFLNLLFITVMAIMMYTITYTQWVHEEFLTFIQGFFGVILPGVIVPTIIGLVMIVFVFFVFIVITLIICAVSKILKKQLNFLKLYCVGLSIHSVYWIFSVSYFYITLLLFDHASNPYFRANEPESNFFLIFLFPPVLIYNLIVYFAAVKTIYDRESKP